MCHKAPRVRAQLSAPDMLAEDLLLASLLRFLVRVCPCVPGRPSPSLEWLYIEWTQFIRASGAYHDGRRRQLLV